VDDQPIVNIVGNKVSLGPLRRDLIPLYQRWHNDFSARVAEWPPAAVPWTLEQTETWYDAAARTPVPERITFTIYRRESQRPIGTTTLYDLDRAAQTARFGIGIGAAADRGQGYGTEAARLTLDYAFTALGLHNVALSVLAHNAAGLRAYTRAGFKEFGRRREAAPFHGKRYDIVYMDCLAREFTSPVLAHVLPSAT
jgi:RimJ/RimL family protein N-acetyltransferase